MNLILAKLFHSIATTNLHFICIHSPFLPWFLTHLTLPFIKTLDSWIFHMTKIYTLEYIRNKITIHFIILWYYRKFTHQYEHRNHQKNLYFSILLKTPSNLHQNSMFYWNRTQNNKKHSWYLKNRVWFSTIKYLQLLLIFPKTMCLRILLLPKTILFGQSQVTSPWSKNNKNSKFKLTMFHY